MGMTVAEGRLLIFDKVVRERDLSLSALALAKACADFPLLILDDPDGSASVAVLSGSGGAQFESRRL
jgi:hypothetical protein